MPKTKIFEYKGYVGIQAGKEVTLDYLGLEQMGCIVKLSNIDITQQALDFLMTLEKTDEVAESLICTENAFAWVGPLKSIVTKQIKGGITYKPEYLKPFITKIEIPQSFKDYIDSL